MGDLKKTFLAGFVVLLIILAAPSYLNFIGYSSNENSDIHVDVKDESVDQKPISAVSVPVILHQPDTEDEIYNIHTEFYNLKFSSKGGGSVQSYQLANKRQFLGGYNDFGVFQNDSGALLINNSGGCAPCVGIQEDGSDPMLLDNYLWELVSILPQQNPNQSSIALALNDTLHLKFKYPLSDTHSIIKEIVFYGNSFVSQHNVTIRGDELSGVRVFLFWDKGINNTEENLYDELTYASTSFSVNDEIETITFSPDDVAEKFEDAIERSGKINWVGIRNKYFIAAFVPKDASSVRVDAVASLLQNSPVPIYNTTVVSSNHELSSRIFLGPLDIDHINALNTSLDRIMNFGWVIIQPFSRGVLWLLKLLHSTGLNYGIILILFAFIVRIITGPLTKKSFESSQKMQAVQPKLKKLQEKYKNDSKKLNQEMMKLYRENDVNPAGGCFPMLLQMPLLFALFLVFRSTIEFRGAPFFGWISNLSQPDTIFNLPFYIPIYGDQVAFLPLLLGISMFLTQKMSMANMDKQQKPMMYMMSAFFFLIFNSFPSGLNLYYLIYNILNYLQQRSLKKA